MKALPTGVVPAILAIVHIFGFTPIRAEEDLSLALPRLGAHGLRVLSPTVLELERVNTKPAGTNTQVDSWNFVDASTAFQAPPLSAFQVSVNGQPAAISAIGFKRRTLYAPLAVRDFRILNHLYLTLAAPIPEAATVTVTNPDETLWPAAMNFSSQADPLRWNPAIHVNQEGYTTAFPKKAMIGYYLGNLGELEIAAPAAFSLVDAATGATVFSGTCTPRADVGYVYSPVPYQRVYQADFSAFQTPGSYRLVVPGLGASVPFTIEDSVVLGFARAYALGLYNQRCGLPVELRYSRHVHEACHVALAEVPVPQSAFTTTWGSITAANGDYYKNARHTAPQLKDPASQLYPFTQTAKVDVALGHHDAGDYSKYTINSAQLLHHLTFAADSFPGAGDLDNLGLPESGNGVGDLLDEAKIEADFLAKMQDADGGFYFLVYPKARKYENNVLPDHGDPQVVWPKNTSATAAALAALAEIGSSPRFKAAYPAEAALYLQKAQAGWTFLMNAIAAHGKDGSYQKITHYGDIFMHDDELAWAAAAMFAATGNPAYQQQLIAWYNPESRDTRRWTWWRLFEAYGCAARTYGFAARSGRLPASQLDAAYLAKCQNEIIAAGQDAMGRTVNCAYGSAFDTESKRQRTAGWYFSSERAFDATAAWQLTGAAGLRDAVITNMNFEGGTNPVNVTYITGLGLRRQREIVHQYAQNDRRALPPSGLPLGNIQTGFQWLSHYGNDIGAVTFPSDGAATAPYPFYDRWGDSYNTMTEFVVPNQARSLASLAFWAAQTPGAAQAWHPPAVHIVVPGAYVAVNTPVTVTLDAPGFDLTTARIAWEAAGQEPAFGGGAFTFTPATVGPQWIEAEIAFPDGRRLAAAATFSTKADPGEDEYAVDASTTALYHFNGNYADSGAHGYHLTPAGGVTLGNDNSGWMADPVGQVARFSALGDVLTVTLPDSKLLPGKTPSPMTLDARIYPRAYRAYGVGNFGVVSLYQAWDCSLELKDGKWNSPGAPIVAAGGNNLITPAQWSAAAPLYSWHHLRVTIDSTGTLKCWVNGQLIATGAASGVNYQRAADWVLTIGNVDADIDEVRISSVVRTD